MQNPKKRKPWPHSKLVLPRSMPQHRRLRRSKNLGSPRSIKRRGQGSQRRTRQDRLRERCATSVLFHLAFIDWFSTLEAAKRKVTSQTIKGLPEGEQRSIPPPSMSSTVIANDDLQVDSSATNNNRFSLHPDDPQNFLKLCLALCILIRQRITELDIDQADCLVCEYCTELILVRLL